MSGRLIIGDCIEAMAGMDAGSVDAVVTDPPYGLGFMGKAWDSSFEAADMPMRRNGAQDAVNAGAARQGGRQRAGADFQKRMARDSRNFQSWCEAWAIEALRVLKPGGHLLAFGGTRTSHRLVCAIEDAGFEIRDTIAWMYGSGFPKSLNVSAAIDKSLGAEPIVTGPHATNACPGGEWCECSTDGRAFSATKHAPATAPATAWQGWGTALKPAHEPIVVARKPLTGTVAASVLEHGTGALNVDGCRIGTDPTTRTRTPEDFGLVNDDGWTPTPGVNGSAAGRWPANVVLDEEAAAMLDGTLTSNSGVPFTRNCDTDRRAALGAFNGNDAPGFYGDRGGASRFFLTVTHDTLCVLCNLPCAQSAGMRSSPADAPNATAPAPVPAVPPRANAGNEAPSSAPATTAGKPSSAMARADTAPPDAPTQLAAWIVQRARSAANLCDSCATATAQSVARTLLGQTPDSPHGAASISARRLRILSDSLALIAAGARSTGTIPTTATLSALCGSVADATTECTTESGTASAGDLTRFRYQSKASSAERNAGLEGFEAIERVGQSAWAGLCNVCGSRMMLNGKPTCGHDDFEWVTGKPTKNVHPTVKPVDLMRWLVRLVTPPGGLVLDPFAGSGTTGCACAVEGVRFVGIEREAEYAAIAEARISWWTEHGAAAIDVARRRREPEDPAALTLFVA